MSTKFKGSKSEINALDAAIKLLRASDNLVSKMSNELSREGITLSQFGILDAIYHLGPLSQSVLGKKISKSGGNVTHVIDNMEKQELVIRKRGINDRRSFEIHLTSKGKRTFKQIFPGQVELIKNYFKILDNDEQESLKMSCKKIGLNNSGKI